MKNTYSSPEFKFVFIQTNDILIDSIEVEGDPWTKDY